MRIFLYGIILLSVIGCRPSVDSEELGDVIYEIPDVPGAEEPYELPKLTEVPPPVVESDADSEAPRQTATDEEAGPAKEPPAPTDPAKTGTSPAPPK